MATILTIALNADTQDLEYNTSGVDWIDVNLGSDELIITAGSDTVADGEPIPSESDLNQAGVRTGQGVEVIVDKYLLSDTSENLLREIHNMGNQNKRYVIAFSFDGATASEPVLELWDNDDLDSIDNTSLGAGTPTSSWWRGVVTTDALPGADWTGIRLAGSSDGHFLWLNNQNGALTTADVLYCNLKVVIPSSANISGAELPVFACKYTTN